MIDGRHRMLKTKTRAYKKWASMMQRCYNSKNAAYSIHGGRGITVDRIWHNFDAFYGSLGECPEGLTLNRIDNEGNYEPGNCNWATYVVQANNRRSNRFLTVDGITKTCAQWAKCAGISRSLLHHRLKTGWTVREALNAQINEEKK
jgi:hypothetical protein